MLDAIVDEAKLKQNHNQINKTQALERRSSADAAINQDSKSQDFIADDENIHSKCENNGFKCFEDYTIQSLFMFEFLLEPFNNRKMIWFLAVLIWKAHFLPTEFALFSWKFHRIPFSIWYCLNVRPAGDWSKHEKLPEEFNNPFVVFREFASELIVWFEFSTIANQKFDI